MLLLGGAFALAGCTFGENIEWLPWSAPDPLPVEIPAGVIERVARTSALAAHLVSNATAWKLTGRRVRTLEWFRTTTAQHLQVLASGDPARRQHATAPPSSLPSPSPTQPTAPATQAALTRELTALRTTHRTAALAASGQAALLWASLAAFSGTAALTLPAGTEALGDDGTELAPDPAGTGTDRILQLAAQAGYAYEMALAATGLSKADAAALRSRLGQWRTLRDAILTATPGADAGPPPIGYDLRPARNRTAAWQLAAQTEAAAVPMLGAWLAGTSSATERRLGVDALGTSNTALVRFGGAALRWPGWPG